jgi:iron complex transport system ATP-binding protein
MRETGVEELAERRLDQVSGGEFKRVLIARALAQDTPALLLDEAAAGLDAAAKMAVCEMMAAKAAKGSLVLAVMHDLNLAALFCHRLVFLKRGRVVLDGPTADVFTRQTLSEIYETPVCVAPHPVTGAPQALFVPASATDAV